MGIAVCVLGEIWKFNVDVVEKFLDGIDNHNQKKLFGCECCAKCFEWSWQQRKNLWSVNVVKNILNEICMNKTLWVWVV